MELLGMTKLKIYGILQSEKKKKKLLFLKTIYNLFFKFSTSQNQYNTSADVAADTFAYISRYGKSTGFIFCFPPVRTTAT